MLSDQERKVKVHGQESADSCLDTEGGRTNDQVAFSPSNAILNLRGGFSSRSYVSPPPRHPTTFVTTPTCSAAYHVCCSYGTPCRHLYHFRTFWASCLRLRHTCISFYSKYRFRSMILCLSRKSMPFASTTFSIVLDRGRSSFG